MTPATGRSGIRIAGRSVEPVEPADIRLADPLSGRPLPPLTGGGPQDARRATDAAADALEGWRATSVGERAAALRRIADRLEEEVAALADETTAETGKRLVESEAEVAFAARYFRWYADLVRGDGGSALRGRQELTHLAIRRPLGVVAVVTPWNFPLSVPARKLAPLLAAGCTAVFKPSEVTPRTSLRLAALVDELLPPGVVNTVIGPPERLGSALLEDDRIRGVTFTGSTRVGRLVARQAAHRFQRSVLELGGNAPFVVLDDADPVAAEACLRTAKYRNNGQSCIAANQVWVHEAVADDFCARVEDTSRALRVGDPRDPRTELGPLALPSDPSRLKRLVGEARGDGAEVVAGGLADDLPPGNFFAPHVCTGAKPDSAVWETEAFGPVMLVRVFADVEQAVEDINRAPVGLAAYLCTRDRFRGVELAARLEVGVVGINNATPNDPALPFGGVKASGWGREGGRAGLELFLEHQMIGVAAPGP